MEQGLKGAFVTRHCNGGLLILKMAVFVIRGFFNALQAFAAGNFSELRLVENADAGNADYADDGKNNKENRNSGFCKIYDLETTRSQEVN